MFFNSQNLGFTYCKHCSSSLRHSEQKKNIYNYQQGKSSNIAKTNGKNRNKAIAEFFFDHSLLSFVTMVLWHTIYNKETNNVTDLC